MQGSTKKYILILATLLLLGAGIFFLVENNKVEFPEEQKAKTEKSIRDSLEKLKQTQQMAGDSGVTAGVSEENPADTIKYPEIFSNGSYHRIFSKEANLYERPSYNSSVIATVHAGDEVKIIARSPEREKNDKEIDFCWYEVQTQIGGKEVKAFVWGGMLSWFSAVENSEDGKKQIILGGLEDYVEPGLFWGGYHLRFKLVQGAKVLSNLLFEDDIYFDPVADHTEILSDTILTAQLKGIKKIYGVHKGGKDTWGRSPLRSWIFVANNRLHHLYSSDSLFVPEHLKGKQESMVRESYDSKTAKPINNNVFEWDGRGIIAGYQTVFGKEAKVYQRPEFGSKVIGITNFGDSLREYLTADREEVLKTENIKGVQLPWSHVLFQKDGLQEEGYIWEGNFAQTKAEFYLPGGKKMKVWTGLKSANEQQTRHVMDIKLQVDTIQYSPIPFYVFGCGIPEGGPYIFPRIEMSNKKMEGVDVILRISESSSCEGSSPSNEIYLFYIGGKWSSISVPPSDYDRNYEVIFPGDKGGKPEEIKVYKNWSQGDKTIRELQKVFKISKDKREIAN